MSSLAIQRSKIVYDKGIVEIAIWRVPVPVALLYMASNIGWFMWLIACAWWAMTMNAARAIIAILALSNYRINFLTWQRCWWIFGKTRKRKRGKNEIEYLGR
jgi:hypothetical protein